MYRQAARLQDDGSDVEILSWRSSQAPALVRGGVDGWPLIRPLGPARAADRQAGEIAKALGYLSLLLAAVRQLRLSRPSVLHLLSYGTFSFVLHIAATFLRIPVTVETTLAGGDDPLTIRAGRYGRLRLRMMRRSQGLVSISPLLDRLAADAGWPASERTIIPNSVDTSQFSPADRNEKTYLRKELELPVDATILANVGAIRPRKGQLHLIEALPTIRRSDPSVLVVLIGPEDKDHESRRYAALLKARAAELGVSECVQFSGVSTDVATWLRASDLFVFTSEREGFGTAQIEAMACGLPVVSLLIPGITDYIIASEDDGVIIEHPPDLAEGICRLVDDRDLRIRLSRMGRETALKRFSDASVTRCYGTFFEACARRKARHGLRGGNEHRHAG